MNLVREITYWVGSLVLLNGLFIALVRIMWNKQKEEDREWQEQREAIGKLTRTTQF
jgi:hypothetical protein